MQVKLIAITKPHLNVGGCWDAEDLVAYCARVSNPKNQYSIDTAPKLLKYLADNQHWSPFEMVHVVMEIETTRDISRQILRHWSARFQEFSLRYAQAPGFVLRECRMQDTKNRQSSLPCKNKLIALFFTTAQKLVIGLCGALYRLLLWMGVAKEQARAVLPEGLTVTRMYMAGSLRTWLHYVQLRSSNGTQKEHAEIARACGDILKREFPALEAFFDGH